MTDDQLTNEALAERAHDERNRQKADFDKYEPEAWKVASLAATISTTVITSTEEKMVDLCIARAQMLLAAARKAVRT